MPITQQSIRDDAERFKAQIRSGIKPAGRQRSALQTPPAKRVGDELQSLLVHRHKATCTRCFTQALRELNAMPVSEARSKRDTYVPMLWENFANADKENRAWAKAVIEQHPKMSDPFYGELFDEACDKVDPPLVARDALFVWCYYLGGSDSTPKGEELRYSMRSVKQNYHGRSEFIVVGDAPNWYTGSHIQQERVASQPRQEYRDVLQKLYRVCTDESLPSEFVWMMDDVYFTHQVSFDRLRVPKYQGSFPASNPTAGGSHSEIKRDTFGVLRASNSACGDFATHLPHVIDRHRWLEMWDEYRLDKYTLLWEPLYWSSQAGRAQQVDSQSLRLIRSPNVVDLESAAIVNNSIKGWSRGLHSALRNKFFTPTPHESFIVSLPGGRAIDLVDGWSTSVQRKIRREGINRFEPLTMRKLIELWGSQSDGFTFFDIGANCGLFSLACSALFPSSNVIGFEPTPQTHALAELIAKQNKFPIVYERIALSDKNGTADFHLSNVSESSNSLRSGFRESKSSISVKTETLDSYCERTGNYPDLIKIDVETFEPEVLRGGRRTIESRLPPIVAEVAKGESVDAIMRELPSNYSATRIEGDDVRENWLFAVAH